MPLKPVTQTLQMPVETSADVDALFEAGVQLVHHPSASYRQKAARDLEDHFFYLGAVHPEYARLLQPKLVRLSDEQLKMFSFTFSTWLYLLQGADDSCVDLLATALNQHPENWVRRQMLAAIGTVSALTNVTAFARTYNAIDDFQSLGFDVPLDGQPARPRFTVWRRVIKKVPFTGRQENLNQALHPIGLPLDAIVEDPSSKAVSWHYLSLNLTELQGLPPLPVEQLHLVSPPIDIGWALYCDISGDGRYRIHSVERDEDEEDEPDETLPKQQNDSSVDLGHAELLPYDDQLIYCNGHTLVTDGVVGDVGGPPLGLYPNPKCLECGRLMFHILTVESQIRSYGEGWRSLFLCEDRQLIACNATSWN